MAQKSKQTCGIKLLPLSNLRVADSKRLRERVEVNEQEAHRVKEGMPGEFTVFGVKEVGGGLMMKMVLASFASGWLFEPDSTARMATRILNVLCEFRGSLPPVFSGQ